MDIIEKGHPEMGQAHWLQFPAEHGLAVELPPGAICWLGAQHPALCGIRRLARLSCLQPSQPKFPGMARMPDPR